MENESSSCVWSLSFLLITTDSVSFSCPFDLPTVLFLLSSGRLSTGLPFACSGRNRPSIVFILSVNGPHIAGHGEAICPHRDGCILRFLQLHFWQTDIWAHLKPGGITFSQVCNVGIWLSCKPSCPQTCLPNAHTALFSVLSHTCTADTHIKMSNENTTDQDPASVEYEITISTHKLYLYRFLVLG